MGFRACILPKAAMERVPAVPGLELLGAQTLREAVRLAIGPKRAASAEGLD